MVGRRGLQVSRCAGQHGPCIERTQRRGGIRKGGLKLESQSLRSFCVDSQIGLTWTTFFKGVAAADS